MNYKNILKNFLNSKDELISFPAKRKMKLISLIYISSKLQKGKQYTEQEINNIINETCSFNDPATIRRELYQNKFIDCQKDCQKYWLEEIQPTLESLGISIKNTNKL